MDGDVRVQKINLSNANRNERFYRISTRTKKINNTKNVCFNVATDTENTEDEIYSFKARRIIGLIVRQFGGA